jgi:alkylhydroperoxidase family enzyme
MSSSMPSTIRIPYRPASVLPTGIPPLHLFRIMAHSPSTLPHVISLGTACFRDTSLSPYLRELVCLLNAKRLSCDYQWKQHFQIAKSIGIQEAKLSAIAAGDVSGEVWAVEEKALLAFLDAVIKGPEIDDVVFATARIHFSDQVLVEVVTMQVRFLPSSFLAALYLRISLGLLLQSCSHSNCVSCRSRTN